MSIIEREMPKSQEKNKDKQDENNDLKRSFSNSLFRDKPREEVMNNPIYKLLKNVSGQKNPDLSDILKPQAQFVVGQPSKNFLLNNNDQDKDKNKT